MQFNFILRFQNLNIVAIFEPQLCYCICKTNTRDGCILSNAESLFPLKIVFLQLGFSRSLQLCRVFPFPTGFSQLLGWAQGHSLVLQPDGSSHPRKPKWPENEMKQGSHPKTRKQENLEVMSTLLRLRTPWSILVLAGWWWGILPRKTEMTGRESTMYMGVPVQ